MYYIVYIKYSIILQSLADSLQLNILGAWIHIIIAINIDL